jgi:beta-glucosidase
MSNNLLPLKKNKLKVYIANMDGSVVADYASIIKTPQETDLAIIQLNTPWYPVETNNPYPFAQRFHHGDLDFKGAEKQRILDLLNAVPTVVDSLLTIYKNQDISL